MVLELVEVLIGVFVWSIGTGVWPLHPYQCELYSRALLKDSAT